MKLYPTPTADQAYEWLKSRAGEEWGSERVPEFEDSLRRLAAAMSAVSAADVPDEQEPFFP